MNLRAKSVPALAGAISTATVALAHPGHGAATDAPWGPLHFLKSHGLWLGALLLLGVVVWRRLRGRRRGSCPAS